MGLTLAMTIKIANNRRTDNIEINTESIFIHPLNETEINHIGQKMGKKL